jgi:hypothetical protein
MRDCTAWYPWLLIYDKLSAGVLLRILLFLRVSYKYRMGIDLSGCTAYFVGAVRLTLRRVVYRFIIGRRRKSVLIAKR